MTLLHDNNTPRWYAMSATHGRSLKAKQHLDLLSVDNYLPLQQKIITLPDGTRQRRQLPAVANLIFIRASWTTITTLKARIPWLHILTRPAPDRRNAPIIVPDRQMTNFIAATANPAAPVTYLTPDELNALPRGTRVRIIGGPLHDTVATLISARGRAPKKLLVSIPALLSAQIHLSAFDLLQPLP